MTIFQRPRSARVMISPLGIGQYRADVRNQDELRRALGEFAKKASNGDFLNPANREKNSVGTIVIAQDFGLTSTVEITPEMSEIRIVGIGRLFTLAQLEPVFRVNANGVVFDSVRCIPDTPAHISFDFVRVSDPNGNGRRRIALLNCQTNTSTLFRESISTGPEYDGGGDHKIIGCHHLQSTSDDAIYLGDEEAIGNKISLNWIDGNIFNVGKRHIYSDNVINGNIASSLSRAILISGNEIDGSITETGVGHDMIIGNRAISIVTSASGGGNAIVGNTYEIGAGIVVLAHATDAVTSNT